MKIAVIFATIAATAAACGTPQYGKCGADNEPVSCCPNGQYCQPWNAGYYQCLPTPSKCPQQLTNVDLYGNDIKTLYGLQPSECCAKCAETAGCKAYTFVNSNPGSPACYLKSAAGAQAKLTGAVSGILSGSPQPPTPSPSPSPPTPSPSPPTPSPQPPTPTPSPNPGCDTPDYGYCGNAQGVKCCPSGQYCQPWNTGYYQCLPTPAKCSQQFTDIDFDGDDLSVVYGLQPSDCCAKCASTDGCKAYTFVNSNPGSPACYLKKGTGNKQKNVGAVSGIVN